MFLLKHDEMSNLKHLHQLRIKVEGTKSEAWQAVVTFGWKKVLRKVKQERKRKLYDWKGWTSRKANKPMQSMTSSLLSIKNDAHVYSWENGLYFF